MVLGFPASREPSPQLGPRACALLELHVYLSRRLSGASATSLVASGTSAPGGLPWPSGFAPRRLKQSTPSNA